VEITLAKIAVMKTAGVQIAVVSIAVTCAIYAVIVLSAAIIRIGAMIAVAMDESVMIVFSVHLILA